MTSVDETENETRKEKKSADDGDADDDDMWAIFTKGLVRMSGVTSSFSESEESIKSVHYYLRLQGCLSIFNVALEELSLLKRIINTPVAKGWDETIVYKSIEDRYGGSRHLVFEESEFDKLTDRQKVQKDICFLYNILRDGFEELLSEDTYHSTVEAIKAMFQLMEDEAQLNKDHLKNIMRIKELKQILIDEKRNFQKILADKKYTLFKLKNEFEDKLVYGRYNVRYIDDWEGSRIEQNHLRNKLVEDGYKKIIDESNIKISYEDRIHSEITMWLESNINDMTGQIEYWQQFYEEERDRRDLEIYNMKTKRDQTIESLEEMKVTYENHCKFIEEWNVHRNEKRAKELQEERELAAAIKIQSWWRGIMVRRHLGPYSKKKGKKGKDKKGKDKKEKKGKKDEKKLVSRTLSAIDKIAAAKK